MGRRISLQKHISQASVLRARLLLMEGAVIKKEQKEKRRVNSRKKRGTSGGQREGQHEMNGAELLVAQKGQAACGQNVAQIIFTLFFAFCFLFLLCL